MENKISKLGLTVSQLNTQQKTVVNTIHGNVLLLAGPGSGKTKTLITRLATMLIDAKINSQNILALTFSKAATLEMKDRLSHLVGNNAAMNVTIKTFHSLAYNIVSTYKHTNYLNMLSEKTKISILRLIAHKIDDEQNDDVYVTWIKTLLSVKNYGITLNQYKHWLNNIENENSYVNENIYKMYFYYQKYLLMKDAYDFDELVMQAVDDLRNNKDLLQKYTKKYQYISVDEYQDTDLLQYHLLKLLSTGNTLVVGDDDQSIYGFRGAQVKNIDYFKNDFKNVKVLKLEYNYRSTKPLVDVANTLIEHNPHTVEKHMQTNVSSDLPIIYQRFKNNLDESNFIINKIHEMMNDNNELVYGDFLILSRTNSPLKILKKTLKDNDIDSANAKSPMSKKVTLSTIHGAKGLEYLVVFIIGLENHVLPIFNINDEQLEKHLQEERRMLYVAMTRAKKYLFLSSAIERTMRVYSKDDKKYHEKIMQNPPSMFLDDFSYTDKTKNAVKKLEQD